MKLYTLELNVTAAQLDEIAGLLDLTIEWQSTNKHKPIYSYALDPFTNDPVGTVTPPKEIGD